VAVQYGFPLYLFDFIVIIKGHLLAQTDLFNEQEGKRCDLSNLSGMHYAFFLQKFLDRCIVEEGDPEDENYKVNQ